MSTESTATTLRPPKPTDVIWRGLYGTEHAGAGYVVEVDFFDPGEKVKLYRNGTLAEVKRSPARFVLDEDTTIKAAMSLYGMKQAHILERDKPGRALSPLPGTAEAARQRFDQEHPTLSRMIAIISWVVLVVALVTQIPNAINGISNGLAALGFPLGFSVPTFALPAWLNAALTVLGIAAGLDRGLRMVHNPLLDD